MNLSNGKGAESRRGGGSGRDIGLEEELLEKMEKLQLRDANLEHDHGSSKAA